MEDFTFNTKKKQIVTTAIEYSVWSYGERMEVATELSLFPLLLTEPPLLSKYHTRTIYIYYSIFEVHFFIFKDVFGENYVLMYG